MNDSGTNASREPAAPTGAVELRIDRLVVDAPAGIRPERLQLEVERCLREGVARAAETSPPPAGRKAGRAAGCTITLSGDTETLAQRIAGAVLKGVWPT